jgi:hypothetical protein
MLQPRAYPELVGKALVLDAEPFMALTDDDEPWMEGLFLTISVGFLVGVAQLIGRLLATATLPPSDAMLAALLQGWRQFSTSAPEAVSPVLMEAFLREVWSIIIFWNGYSGGWARLLLLVTTPSLLLLQWLLAGAIVYITARFLGGVGTLNQTLGATALMVAPQALRFAELIPFATVSQLLLSVWALLIIYRAVEVAHDLPWQRALLAALTPWLLLLVLTVILSILLSVGLIVWRLA